MVETQAPIHMTRKSRYRNALNTRLRNLSGLATGVPGTGEPGTGGMFSSFSMVRPAALQIQDRVYPNCNCLTRRVCLRRTNFLADIDQPDRFENYIAGDLQTLRAELVNRVLRGVVERVVVPVVKINDIGHRYAKFRKRHMI